MSLVEASELCVERFAANCANTALASSILWGIARSAFGCASASSSYNAVGLFANTGSVLFWTAATLASRHTTGAMTSSISESIGKGLHCHFCLKWDMLLPFTRYKVYTCLAINALRVVQPFTASLQVAFFCQSIVYEFPIYIGSLFVVFAALLLCVLL